MKAFKLYHKKTVSEIIKQDVLFLCMEVEDTHGTMNPI